MAKRPRLRVVAAGDAVAPRPGRSPRLANGLTMKQEAFCQAMASGDSPSLAYRKAFDSSGMATATIYARSSELAARSNIRARIDEAIAERDRESLHDKRRATSWIFENLKSIAEQSDTDGARVAAIQTVARMHALLTDKQEVETSDSSTTEDLRQQLAEALATLAAPTKLRA